MTDSVFVACDRCIHSIMTRGMRVCEFRHTDVTNRGRLPCSHFEEIDDSSDADQHAYNVDVCAYGNALIRVTACSESDAEDQAIDQATGLDTCSWDLRFEITQVRKVSKDDI